MAREKKSLVMDAVPLVPLKEDLIFEPPRTIRWSEKNQVCKHFFPEAVPPLDLENKVGFED